MRRRLALLLPLALLAYGSAGAEGPARAPSAAATAWAIKIAPPAVAPVSTPVVVAPPNAAPSAGGVFSYPSDGSIVSAQSTTATATAAVQANAAANAGSVVTALSLFKGELTADAVTARASAGTGYSGAGGNANGSTVLNLKVEGVPVAPGVTKVALGDWGQLAIGTQTVERSAAPGTQGYRGVVTELDVHLTADHDGLPATSEIQIGYAEAAVQTAPPPAAAGTTTTTETLPTPTEDPSAGDAPRLRPKQGAASKPVPLKLHPKLTAGHYVFPVYGAASYIDTFGAARADVTYHHGDDIFGRSASRCSPSPTAPSSRSAGTRSAATGSGSSTSRGTSSTTRTSPRSRPLRPNGAHVKAGQVVGFMGNTGDAEGTPYHLHFEVHPVSLLYLGYDGAVDPTPYLDAWKHQQDLPFPVAAGWAPQVPGGPSAPEPGAILLGMNDISTADGLDPASLERALTPLKASALMQTLVPTVPAPTTDLGRG